MSPDDTYVPIFRSLLNHRYMQDSEKLHFWVWCLLKATYTPCKILVGNQTVALEVGQFIFGRKAAALELGMSEQNIRTLLKFFSSKAEQKLTIKSTNKYSVITVIDYGTYMKKVKQTNHQSNQRLTSKSPAPNHKQEGKEGKENKKPFRPPSGDHQIFIAWWKKAYETLEGQHYLFDGKDGQHVKVILETMKLNEAIARAADFMLSEDPFYKGKKDIPFFRSQINKFKIVDMGQVEELRELDLAPPEGVKFEDWKFWEVDSDTEAA